jgi:DNA-binding GntR family transcriptional regulator
MGEAVVEDGSGLEVRKLYELVYAGLKESLMDARLAGVVLSPADLALSLSVSRDPIVRALSMLEAEGVLERIGPTKFVRRPFDGTAAPAAAVQLLFSPALLAAIQERTSWQRVYREAEQTIAALMPFGSFRVIESAMAEQYGVSRTITASVIGRLAERGLIQRGERGRWQVLQMTADELQHLYQLRELLEPAALVDSVPRLPAGEIEAALQRVSIAEASAADLDQAQLQDLEHDLHVRALARCGNTKLLAMVAQSQMLWIASDKYLRMYPLLPTDMPYLREHRLVFEHLAMGNYDVAAEALRAHLRVSFARVKRRIALVSSYDSPPIPAYMQPIAPR